MNTVLVLVTDVGDFVAPHEMVEAAKSVRFRNDGWPDLRTNAGKGLAKMFNDFSDMKLRELAA